MIAGGHIEDAGLASNTRYISDSQYSITALQLSTFLPDIDTLLYGQQSKTEGV